MNEATTQSVITSVNQVRSPIGAVGVVAFPGTQTVPLVSPAAFSNDLSAFTSSGSTQFNVGITRARDMLTTRTYPIDDLVVSGFGAAQYGPFWGQVVARQQALSNAQGIINMIQTSIEPAMWSTNGGPCSISFFEPGMALVVRAPAEMHYMLGNSLYGR